MHRRGSAGAAATPNRTNLVNRKIHGIDFGEISIRFDVRRQLRTNSGRVVLPRRLPTHTERFGNLLPRRSSITSGFDLRPTDRFQLSFATRQLPQRGQRVHWQGINRNNTHDCQDNLTHPGASTKHQISPPDAARQLKSPGPFPDEELGGSRRRRNYHSATAAGAPPGFSGSASRCWVN